MEKDDAKEEDIYEEEGMQEAEESDEIDELEEGFMHGYEHDLAKCAKCGRVLIEPGTTIEKEIDGEAYRFCSSRCADGFKKEE